MKKRIASILAVLCLVVSSMTVLAADPAADSTLTIAQARELAATKSHNTYTSGKYYVTGKIKNVYDSTWGNMYIVDEDGNELCIYGTYTADGKTRYDKMSVKPVAGDTVTVYGIIGKYNTTLQIKNGWITAHTVAEQEPTTQGKPDPAANSTLTIAEALELGKSKAHDTYTAGKYYVTGKVVEIKTPAAGKKDYGNMYIVDENGNKLYVYGTYSADGKTGYADMEVKPAVGDTVTFYGIIGQYNGTAQIKNAWATKIVPATTEQPTTEAPTTQAPTTEAPTTQAPTTEAPTTAGNAGGNNGGAGEGTPSTADSSNVIVILAIACAAVAVVFATKKQNA